MLCGISHSPLWLRTNTSHCLWWLFGGVWQLYTCTDRYWMLEGDLLQIFEVLCPCSAISLGILSGHFFFFFLGGQCHRPSYCSHFREDNCCNKNQLYITQTRPIRRAQCPNVTNGKWFLSSKRTGSPQRLLLLHRMRSEWPAQTWNLQVLKMQDVWENAYGWSQDGSVAGGPGAKATARLPDKHAAYRHFCLPWY